MDEMTLLKELRADRPAMSVRAEDAARARLLAGAAGPPARSRRPLHLVLGLAAATAVATAATVVVNAFGPEPARDYANAAMKIERETGTWRVEIKDAYADPGEFAEAFAKMGLRVELRIVPVSPGKERTIIRMVQGPSDAARTHPDGSTSSWSVDDCPAEGTACPLAMTISGDPGGGRQVWLGREARPGEPYADGTPGLHREPVPGLRLIGRNVRDATALLRARGLKSAFLLGEFKPDGSGSSYGVDPSWRPSGERKATDAWYFSSDTVMLLVSPRPGDPGPTPDASPLGD
ncbi:hypothetical protein [Actinocorallia libanotica]|uniref:PASTA domain-containing protein n=1 Tax=Actinocorallia libanotica TaxID=46162 RepID=A0ABN1RHR2_9ACTN